MSTCTFLGYFLDVYMRKADFRHHQWFEFAAISNKNLQRSIPRLAS